MQNSVKTSKNCVKVDLPKMQEGREDAVFMVAYLHQDARDDESLQAATQKAVDIFYQISEQVKLNESQVGIAYNVDDLIYLKNAGKKAIFLAIENGYAIGKDLNNLSMFKDMGITYITLCHNGSNDISDIHFPLASSYQTFKPEKPINARAIRPAVTRAMGKPSNALG